MQIIVVTKSEGGHIIVSQMTKSMIPLLHDESRNDERNTDIGYPVGTRRGYPLHIPDKRAAAEGVIGLNVSTWAKAPIDTPSRRHSNSNFFIYQIQDSDRIGKTCSHRLPTAGTGTDAAADTPHDIAQNSDQRGIADHFEPLYPRERRSTEHRTSEFHDQYLSDGDQQQHQEERTASRRSCSTEWHASKPLALNIFQNCRKTNTEKKTVSCSRLSSPVVARQ